jgi:membrane-associated phospholipid phosphatase
LVIQQPRPKEHDHKILKDYGMPSCHAQTAAFSLVFIFLVFQKDSRHIFSWIYLVYLVILINSCRQRVKHNFHTLLQVIVGFVVGIIVGYIFYYMGVKKTIGLIKYKIDDNAPI